MITMIISTRAPKLHGGLGIRCPALLNMAFREKLDWNLRTHPNSSWARILKSKYQMPKADSNKQCSPTWKLINNSSSSVDDYLNWIPRNGEAIRLRTDSILRQKPLNQIEELRPLRDHMKMNGIKTSTHISYWK